MKHVVRSVAFAGAALALLACADAPVPTSASPLTSTRDAQTAPPGQGVVVLHDECDAATFNAVLGDGTCTRTGPGVPFTNFVAGVTRLQSFPAWRMTPIPLNLQVGDTFSAKNIGGEVHTFTEVAQFGGSINPLLNPIIGNHPPAPECLALAPGDFINPGATSAIDDADTPGDELYQCCIHPWMRTVIHIHGASSTS
jgi:hypothetical protein